MKDKRLTGELPEWAVAEYLTDPQPSDPGLLVWSEVAALFCAGMLLGYLFGYAA